MVKINPKKISRALYDVTREQGIFDKIFSDVLRVKKDLSRTPELLKFLSDAKINIKVKQDALKKVYRDEIANEVYNCLLILIKNNALEYFDEVIDELIKIRSSEEGIIEVTAISAMPVSEKTKNNICETVSEKTGKKPVIKIVIDESIIGGLILKINDLTIDGSINGRIERLKTKIKTLS